MICCLAGRGLGAAKESWKEEAGGEFGFFSLSLFLRRFFSKWTLPALTMASSSSSSSLTMVSLSSSLFVFGAFFLPSTRLSCFLLCRLLWFSLSAWVVAVAVFLLRLDRAVVVVVAKPLLPTAKDPSTPPPPLSSTTSLEFSFSFTAVSSATPAASSRASLLSYSSSLSLSSSSSLFGAANMRIRRRRRRLRVDRIALFFQTFLFFLVLKLKTHQQQRQ